MERLFRKQKNSLNNNLVNYILRSLTIHELLNVMRVNQKMNDLLKKCRRIQIFKRLLQDFTGLSYMEMLTNNSRLIETTIATEMNLQKTENICNFDLDDWKELKEIVIFILTMKLVRQENIELTSEVEKKTLFYLRESLCMSKRVLPKKLCIRTGNVGKYSSKILTCLILNERLTELDLTKSSFTKIGFRHLFSVFMQGKFGLLNPLRKLILKRCELGDRRIREVLHSLQNKQNLNYLDLTNNKIQEEPFVYLANNSNYFYFENLIVDFNEISKKGAKCLGIYISKNRCIKKLSVVSSLSNGKNINYISKALEQFETNSGVEKLTLGLNTLLDNTVKSFIESLKRTNSSLRCLKIFFWEFTDNGLKLLFDFLTDENCKLTQLYFCSVGLGDKFEIFERLIKSLSKNCSVEKLIFSQCDLENKHAKSLAELLDINFHISYLDLRDNFISEKEKQILKRIMHTADRKLNILT